MSYKLPRRQLPGARFTTRDRCSHRRDRYYSDYSIRPIQARPPRSRGAAACDAAASAASCSGLGLCGFLRDGVDSAGFCDLYYGLKEDYSGGDAAGERSRSHRRHRRDIYIYIIYLSAGRARAETY